jgi:hypothetical protein
MTTNVSPSLLSLLFFRSLGFFEKEKLNIHAKERVSTFYHEKDLE